MLYGIGLLICAVIFLISSYEKWEGTMLLFGILLIIMVSNIDYTSDEILLKDVEITCKQ